MKLERRLPPCWRWPPCWQRAPSGPTSSRPSRRPWSAHRRAGDADARRCPALVAAQAIGAEWWRLFGSPELDALVRAALAGSPTLDQARAKLTQARDFVPRAPAAATAAGRRRVRCRAPAHRPATFGFPQVPNPGVFSVFSLGAGVSYDFDVFGGTRRDLGRSARVDVQRFELGRRGSCSGSVVVAAIPRRGLRGADRGPRALLGAQRANSRSAGATRGRRRVGARRARPARAVGAGRGRAAAAACAACAGGAPAEHLLVGRAPGEARVAGASRGRPDGAASRAVAPPSELVRQRPDIPRQRGAAAQRRARRSASPPPTCTQVHRRWVVLVGAARMSDLFGSGINVWNSVSICSSRCCCGELKRASVPPSPPEQAARGVPAVRCCRACRTWPTRCARSRNDAQAFAFRSEQSARADGPGASPGSASTPAA